MFVEHLTATFEHPPDVGEVRRLQLLPSPLLLQPRMDFHRFLPVASLLEDVVKLLRSEMLGHGEPTVPDAHATDATPQLNFDPKEWL